MGKILASKVAVTLTDIKLQYEQLVQPGPHIQSQPVPGHGVCVAVRHVKLGDLRSKAAVTGQFRVGQ